MKLAEIMPIPPTACASGSAYM